MSRIAQLDLGTKPARADAASVTLTIDGRSITAPAGTSVLRAAALMGTNIRLASIERANAEAEENMTENIDAKGVVDQQDGGSLQIDARLALLWLSRVPIAGGFLTHIPTLHQPADKNLNVRKATQP
jgi:hypothetical protein